MVRTPQGLRERLGETVGRWCAPPIYAIARLREARMIYPEGHTFAGRAVAVESPLCSIGEQLAGRVLARCSSAMSRSGRERFDVLGIALRFRPGPGPVLDHCAAVYDQDLLFATLSSPLALPLAPFLTDASDFLGNRYWGVSPFAVHSHCRVELRLSPAELARPPSSGAGSRADRLRAAVDAGCAAWWLEARRTLTARWHPVAQVVLEQPIAIDECALRFDPFRTGCGLMPVGFVHALRRATYGASQRGRR